MVYGVSLAMTPPRPHPTHSYSVLCTLPALSKYRAPQERQNDRLKEKPGSGFAEVSVEQPRSQI